MIPFLWIAPLSLYLLSFIICFDHERWYIPRLYAAATLSCVSRRRALGHCEPLGCHIRSMDPANFDKIQFEAALSFAGMFLDLHALPW